MHGSPSPPLRERGALLTLKLLKLMLTLLPCPAWCCRRYADGMCS